MKHKGLGVRDATKVTMALVQWAIATDALGKFPSVRQFTEWSGESKATVERRRARIKAHLDEHEFHYIVGELRAGTRHRFRVPSASSLTHA